MRYKGYWMCRRRTQSESESGKRRTQRVVLLRRVVAASSSFEVTSLEWSGPKQMDANGCKWIWLTPARVAPRCGARSSCRHSHSHPRTHQDGVEDVEFPVESVEVENTSRHQSAVKMGQDGRMVDVQPSNLATKGDICICKIGSQTPGHARMPCPLLPHHPDDDDDDDDNDDNDDTLPHTSHLPPESNPVGRSR